MDALAENNKAPESDSSELLCLGNRPINQALVGLWSSLGHLYHKEIDIYTEIGRQKLIAWWFKHGQLEYKGYSLEMNRILLDEYHRLDYWNEGDVLPVSSLMKYVYNARPDISKQYPDLSIPEVRFAFWQWWILFGFLEYGLAGNALPKPYHYKADNKNSLTTIVLEFLTRLDKQTSPTSGNPLRKHDLLYWWLHKRKEARTYLDKWLNDIVIGEHHSLLGHKSSEGLTSLVTPLMRSVLSNRHDLEIFRDKSNRPWLFWEWWLSYSVTDYGLQTHGLPSDLPLLCSDITSRVAIDDNEEIPVSKLLLNIYISESPGSTGQDTSDSHKIPQWLREGALYRFSSVSTYFMVPEHFITWDYIQHISTMKDMVIDAIETSRRVAIIEAIGIYLRRLFALLRVSPQETEEFMQNQQLYPSSITDKLREAVVRLATLRTVLLQEQADGNSTKTDMEIKDQSDLRIIGYPKGLFGIGEDARLVFRSACKAGFDCRLFQALRPQGASTMTNSDISDGQPSGHKGINIYCMPAFDTIAYYFDAGPDAFNVRYNIGLWQWELPDFPEPARFALEIVDEIWTISTYSAAAIRKSTHKPVYVIPLPVTQYESTCFDRSEFSLPEDAFLFLCVLDGASYIARKNPLAVIEAFQRAFQGSRDVHLVVKAMNISHSELWRECVNRSLADSRITLITDVISEERMSCLYAVSDCVVSLHRAEGFGRVVANGLLHKKPVISSAFSGPLDFVNQDSAYLVRGTNTRVLEGDYLLSRNSSWFSPDIDHAAELMRTIVKDPMDASRRARSGQQIILRKFSIDACASFINARIRKINQTL